MVLAKPHEQSSYCDVTFLHVYEPEICLKVILFDWQAYGNHNSERVLARCLAGRRRDVVIASKFGRHVGGSVKEYTATDIEQVFHNVVPITANM